MTKKTELTLREKEVGTYFLMGLTAKQVARRLGISVHTVADYQRVIKKKLQGKTPYQVGWLLLKQLAEDKERLKLEAVSAEISPRGIDIKASDLFLYF